MIGLKRLQKIEAFKKSISGLSLHTTPEGWRFGYQVVFTQEYIHVVGATERAEFLKRHGFIHTFTVGKHGDVHMYVMKTSADEKEAIQWKDPQKVQWTDFEFTAEQVMHFAAVNEYEKKEARESIRTKVIQMNPFKRRA